MLLDIPYDFNLYNSFFMINNITYFCKSIYDISTNLLLIHYTNILNI